MRKTLALGAALTAIAAGSVLTPATAAAPTPTAHVGSVSKVRLIGGHPYVAGTYSCTGKVSHLWVSAKQGKGDLSQEGSGAQARSWFDRTKDNRLTCDGKEHTAVVRLFHRDGGRLVPEPRGRLAWVQFCLLTANSMKDLGGPDSAFSSNMHYRHVIRPGGSS